MSHDGVMSFVFHGAWGALDCVCDKIIDMSSEVVNA